MTNSGRAGVFDTSACCDNGIAHLIGSSSGDDAIGCAVIGPDGDRREEGSLIFIASAGERHGGGDAVGSVADDIPSGDSSHGEAGDIDAIGVDGIGGDDLVKDRERGCHGLAGCGFLRIGVRDRGPVEFDPALIGGTWGTRWKALN